MSAVTAPTQSREIITQQVRQRHLLDQIGRVVSIIILVTAAVLYVAAPIQAVNWLQHPYIGTVLEHPLTANFGAVDTDFLVDNPQIGTTANLRNGDTVLSVDGTAVDQGTALQNTRSFYRILRRYEAGDAIQLTVRRAGSSEVQTVGVLLRDMPLGQMLGLFLLPYLTGLLYMGIGLWVYRSRRNHIVGRVFMDLTASIAIVLGGVFDLWTTHTFVRVWTFAVPWAAALLATFAMLFPSETPLVARRPYLRWVPFLIALPLIVYGQFQLTTRHEIVAQVWRFGYYVGGAAVLFFLISLLVRSLNAPSPSVREQSRVVLGGAFISFIPFVLWALNAVNIQIELMLFSFLLFPVVLAYSIIQYSVLDTNRLISFAATYTIMASAITIGYALLVAGLNAIAAVLFYGSVSATNPVLVAALAFGLVVGFQPIRNRLQGTIDSFFFRSRSEYEERLTAFRHDLTLVAGLGEVVRLLKQQIREGIVPTHTYVFLRQPESNEFVAAGESARPETDIRFEPESGLVHALSTARDVIFLEYNKPLPPELVEEHARLAILRTPVMVPLHGQDRLAGFVAIGAKRSGEAFDVADLSFAKGLAEQASLAVERAQVISDLERRLRELDVLSQVSQAVNFTTDPDVLLELIYAQSSKLVDTTNFYIITHNKELGSLTYAFFLENDERFTEREAETWPDTDGLAAGVVQTGRPIRTDDYLRECNKRGLEPRETRHYAWMGVPLNAGTRTLGCMVVASYNQHVTFTDDQLKMFWAIADQAATALDKARLFTETETRARQLATLNEISREIATTLDLEALLQRIMSSAVDLIGSEAGTLYLIDENTGEIVFRVVSGGAQNLVGQRLPPGTGLVGQAADTKQPVMSNNVLQDERWASSVDRETEFQTRALLSVPMLVQDSAIGVLQVINRKDGLPFTDEDASLLTTFASQASVAIENARLYEATDAELARRVDELQNLQRIDRELNRTLELDRVIRITLDWALRITGADAGLIGLFAPEGEGLQILASTGFNPEFVDEYSNKLYPVDKGLVGRVMRTGQPEFVPDVMADPEYVPLTQSDTVAQITVPILRANTAIGALVLETSIPDLFAPLDFEFAQRLVEHAAVAIENARLVQEVQDANRSKTEFISFIAHELKNPMTSIRGYTDLVKSGSVGEINEMQGQFLGTIRSNVDRMSRLVSDLRDVARIETGDLHLDMDLITLQSIVDETVNSLRSQIDEKSQDLVIDIPEDLPTMWADQTRMVQVMTNLLSNAHKYTPEEGRIEIGARQETQVDEETGDPRPVIHQWVRDTGIGMSEEDLEQLFTKFFRTARGKDMAQGTGLGLNITKNLIERHGGRIWVESEVGKGSIFHYTIATEPPEAIKRQMEEAAG